MSSAVFPIPLELTQHILAHSHPSDVASFSKSCRAAYNLVYKASDQFLWRELYHAHPFDPPANIDRARRRLGLQVLPVFDWKTAVVDRLRAEMILRRGILSHSDRHHAVKILIAVIEESALAIWQTGTSYNITWLKPLIRQTSILADLLSLRDDEEHVQLNAQLRAYLNFAIDKKTNSDAYKLLEKSRNNSRAYVYDLRNYNSQNNWGPFLPDGRVNWIHIEQLVNVASMNIRELPHEWIFTRPPSCLSMERYSPSAGALTPVTDWAGVQGTWRRYVCFMDYRDLFAFNFTDLADGPRHPKFFMDSRFREAIRLIEIKLHVTAASNLRFYRLPDLNNLNPRLPPLCFTGTSKGVNGNEATVEGYVILGKDNVARWYFMSIYENQPQWSSNGVQLGGLGSPMGVIGIWTTTAHDQDDPVGPFWLWKVDDNSPTHLMEYT